MCVWLIWVCLNIGITKKNNGKHDDLPTSRFEVPGFQSYIIPHLVGGIPTPLKNDGVRQLGVLFPIYGKIKNVPNHQPIIICFILKNYYKTWYFDNVCNS